MWRIDRPVLDGCVDKYLAKGYNVVRELRSEKFREDGSPEV